MSIIDAKTVEKLAKLSRLKVTEEEKTILVHELTKVMDLAAKVQSINTDGVEPMTSVIENAQTPERADEVSEENRRDEYLKIAPHSEMGFYVVPRSVE